MHCVNNELVKTDIFNPTSSLKIGHEDPGRNDQNVANQHPNQFVFDRSLAPLVH